MPKKPASTAIVRLSTAPEDLVADVRRMVGAGVSIDAALLDAAMRGWSVNTRRAFRSDLGLWGQWCRQRGVAPGAAAPSDVAAWVRALAGVDPSDQTVRAMATIDVGCQSLWQPHLSTKYQSIILISMPTILARQDSVSATLPELMSSIRSISGHGRSGDRTKTEPHESCVH